MKLIYIAHEYGGKKENKLKVEEIIKDLIKKYPDYIFISPIHSFGYLYNEVTYEKGIEYCLTLLDLCDEMWIYKRSKGVEIEMDYCFEHGIPYMEVKDERMVK